jgi:small-conductance mechanosensitive channel
MKKERFPFILDRLPRNRGITSSASQITLVFLFVAILVVPIPGLAAISNVPASLDLDAPPTQPTATVTLDGEVLCRVHGVTAYPAERRAQKIAARIQALAADPSVLPETFRVEEAVDRSNILGGDDHFVMSVFDADATLEGTSRQHLAEGIRARIIEAVISYRHDRSTRVLLINTAYALATTLGLVLLLVFLHRAFRWSLATAEPRFMARIEGLEAQSFRIIRAKRLWATVRGLLHTLHIVLLMVIGYMFLNLVLGLYPWTKALARRLFAVFLDPLRTMGAAFLDALPNLAFLMILIIVTRYGLKAVRLFFIGIAHGTVTLSGFEREWAMPTYRIIRMLLIAFSLVVAYPYIPGSQSEAFKGISIFLGIIFSLGSSSLIGNVIAGYTMTYRRAYKLGDRIRVNDIEGDVVEMRLLVTHLRTVKNEEIVVPNSLILNSHVINYTTLAQSRGLILHTAVGIGYEVPWRQVEALLRMAAERTPGLLSKPQPFVLQKALGDFAVTYELNVYSDDPQAMPQLYTTLHQNILDVFNEHGVQIMTPAYQGDPDAPKMVPKDQWFAAPAKNLAELTTGSETDRATTSK